MGDEYVHRHMLRGFITPLWGDTLDTAKQGTYFARDYTITLPEAIKDVTVKAEDIEVIALRYKRQARRAERNRMQARIH